MSELLPCPFCGGEPTAIETYPGRGELYCGNCDVVMGGNNAMTPEELTAAWNSRAERTCRIAEYADAPFPVCSECGAVQPDDFTVYYCWNCGAKVIGGNE